MTEKELRKNEIFTSDSALLLSEVIVAVRFVAGSLLFFHERNTGIPCFCNLLAGSIVTVLELVEGKCL